MPGYADERSTASSVHANDPIGTSHGKGGLDSDQAWSAGKNSKGEWWQMDLGTTKEVGGVVTQGRTTHDQYVTKYKVQTSTDGNSWTWANAGEVFTANTAANNVKVENRFAWRVSARYVRIVVEDWNGHISMRAGVLVCKGDVATQCLCSFT